MRSVTSGFKTAIKKLGRELDVIITFGNDTYNSEDVYYFNYSYDGGLMKSVMAKLELELKDASLEVGDIINAQVGVKVNNSFEYIDYGDFVVDKIEEKEDSDTRRIVAYDKMIYAMKPYKDVNYLVQGMEFEFPMTLEDYLLYICMSCGMDGFNWGSSQHEPINLDRVITSDPYLDINGKDLGYTYRDILDDIAEATGSIIRYGARSGYEYYLLYYPDWYANASSRRIEETSLKDINVDFGEEYGPINSVVLSRSAESDNIYRKDEDNIQTYGLCEVKIVDNQIMNGNDREDYLDDLLYVLEHGSQESNRLLTFCLNDYKSTGVLWLEAGDCYSVRMSDNTSYNCLMLNDEVVIQQGLEENVYTELPPETTTDYSKADTTERKIKQAYLMVDKQNGKIDGVVSDFTEYTTITDSEIGKLKETTTENKTAISTLTASGGRLEVLEQRVTNNETNFNNMVVEININGINVSTNESAISTLIDNEKFVVMNNGTPLAFIGYDSSDGITKAEMEYLTVRTYFTVGHHRVEEYVENYEDRTGWFYIG